MLVSFAVDCYASANPVIAVEYFEEYCDEYAGLQTEASVSGSVADYYSDGSVYSCVYSSYSLLNDLEKEYYDKIVSLDVGVLSFTINYSPNLTKKQFESIDFSKIMNAVCLDHPEIFYYNGYSYRKSYYPSNGSVVSVTYQIGIKKYKQTDSPIYNAADIPEYYDDMLSVVDSVSFNTDTRYDFIKSLHDYLSEELSYVNDYSSCFDAYGALVNKEAVCQGYAESFKIFCDKYNVPCVCITGTANEGPHMWNAVQMDDGKWYLVDVTWDDQGEYGIYNDFFLVGLETKDTYFTREAFNVSHVSDGSPYLPVLPYSDVAFNSADKYSAFALTPNCNADLNKRIIILSYYDSADNNIYFNGMYVPVDDYFTTARFMAPTGKNNALENWKMILIGDCNGDGSSDTSDYAVAVNNALSGEEITDDFDIACDSNFDGVIDALDVAILERAISGANDKIIVE